MKRLQIPQKIVYEKVYVHEKILCAQNCCRNIIKNILPEKRKENMQIKQGQFKLRLNKKTHYSVFTIYSNSVQSP